MIRGAIGRIRRSAPLAVAIILTTSVAVGYSSTPASAFGIHPATGSSSDEQQRGEPDHCRTGSSRSAN